MTTLAFAETVAEWGVNADAVAALKSNLAAVQSEARSGRHLSTPTLRPICACSRSRRRNNEGARPTFALRPFLIEDTPLLAEIFRASIEELTADDYSEGQQGAWASGADDEEQFARRLGDQLTLIATMNGSPVGFASLANNETIDLLYVHPAAAGQGAGAMLVDALEKLAAARGAKG